jgi:signal transduction histidine kinase
LDRLAQESLWNAIRHSGASKIDIKLRSDAECVYLDICDNGKGFDQNLNRSKRGLGLASMTERVRLVGGIIKIQNAPEFGVAIAVIVPIPDPPNP